MVTSTTYYQLCAVCGQYCVKPNTIYCGHECRGIAGAFIQRTQYYRSILVELGFKIERKSGIFFSISLPEELRGYYPAYNHNFTFPQPHEAIEALSSKAILTCVEGYIGKSAVNVILNFTHKDYCADINFRSEFFRQVSALWGNANETALCPHCARCYITTAEGWDAQQDCCTDCGIDMIPF